MIRRNCEAKAVGWIYDSVMSLREVGLDYCSSQLDTTAEERGWIDAYTKLAHSRLTTIGECNHV